ncbi:Nose resistant to fluoxetine protein 6 [Araneus ventricosus]|uniref:Nose resistant to fluoxetine protein 6 n=1 Tax=Araneus ventricosus TaxID=182803 RepID=A0A4Y2IYL3_ARAVE|nr:Nose resistant to fluoxetine protein 6 [Araneus ventricosus]
MCTGASTADTKTLSSNLLKRVSAEIENGRNFHTSRNNTKMENQVSELMRVVLKYTLPFVIDIVDQSSVSIECTESLARYASDLVDIRSWAMEMFDATSKLPSGILEGTLSELGSYDQCLDIEVPFQNESMEFQGQYCGVEVNRILPKTAETFYFGNEQKTHPLSSIGKFFQDMGSVFYYSKFRFGLCVPSKCSLPDMQRVAVEIAKRIKMEVLILECYTKKPVELETIHIAVFVAAGVLFAVCVAGSCLEYYSMKKHSTEKKNGKTQRALLCFSLIANFRHLIAASERSDKLKVLQGMKALTIAWIMFGHNYAWTNFPLARRPKLLTDAYQKLEFGFILNSWLSVEPFFLMNGLVASYTVLQVLIALKGRINIPLYILRKYFKILMLLLLTIGLAFFMPVVSSGPFWYDVVDQELRNCRENWWFGLLFISNWISMKKICISPMSWFISTDLQLHSFSVIPLYILYKSRKVGVLFVLFTVIASNIAIGWTTFMYDLLPFIQMSCGDKQKIQDTIDNVHLRPYTHAGPYYVGVLLGVVILDYRNIKLSASQNVMGWICSILLALTALYGGHNWNVGNPEGPLVTALFAAMHRTTFALSVAWVAFVCITNNGGPVNMLLSSPMLAPAGKLTYMIFMLHSLIFWVRAASVRERLYVSHYNLHAVSDFDNMKPQAQNCFEAPPPTLMSYCPTATRKTLHRVASSRRIEERRETGIKSTATFGKSSVLR